MTKHCYIHASLDIVIRFLLHIYNRVENVIKHVLLYMHDIKVTMEEIDLPIRKLLENTSLYPIVGQTRTRKLLFTGLETKHNVTML